MKLTKTINDNSELIIKTTIDTFRNNKGIFIFFTKNHIESREGGIKHCLVYPMAGENFRHFVKPQTRKNQKELDKFNDFICDNSDKFLALFINEDKKAIYELITSYKF